ncbi:hypothetical protein DL96DRAFT_1584078 [Flagelloscypha sp. PMI_526]|nr:hypothetical protein DL96DRAFT_1584078 [Flagelloscypha sp. PMI_526]
MLLSSLITLGSLVHASPSPRQLITGRLQVSIIGSGFVGTMAANNPISGVIWSIETPLAVSFDPTISPFNVEITNAGYAGPFYLGASGVQDIGLGDFNRSEVTNISPTPPNSPPVPINSYTYIESAIWSFDAATSTLTPQFVNADSSLPDTVFCFDLRYNRLFIIGDLALYNSHSGNNASPVVSISSHDGAY